MRLNNRNKQEFWYALYDNTVASYDEYGNPAYYYHNPGTYQTGTHATYKNPVKAYGNISPAAGSAMTQPFGEDIHYDRVIALENRDTPIDEYAVLWIDTVPELDANGALKVNANGEIVTPWDYIVRGVGRGLPIFGGAIIAAGKVNVS